MVFDPPVIDLLFAFLFLVPGFLSYRLARHFGKITVESDSFNKTVYSLIFSGIAIAITWLFAAAFTDLGFMAIVDDGLSSIQWAVFYLGVIGISATQGAIIGLLVDKGLRRDHKDSRERVWTMAFNGSKTPREIRIVTKQGDVIHGYAEAWDSVGHGKDVLLHWPRKLLEDHEQIGDDDGVFIGNYVLISETDISHIYFEEDVDVTTDTAGPLGRAWGWAKPRGDDSNVENKKEDGSDGVE